MQFLTFCFSAEVFQVLPSEAFVPILDGIALIFFGVACAENRVDNTGMFSLFLSRAYTKSELDFHPPLPSSEQAGAAQGAGGDAARTAEPNHPKGYYRP